MTKKERVIRAMEFTGPDRVPFGSFVPGISDIFYMTYMPAKDWQPEEGYVPNMHPAIHYLSDWKFNGRMPDDIYTPDVTRQDEFGSVWKSSVAKTIGEVSGFPLKNWDDLESFKLPDPYAPGRFDRFNFYRKLLAGDSFVLGNIENGPWERSHFLRGLPDMLMDTVAEPEKVERLADRITDEWLIPMIGLYASHGANGVIMTEDWGTQQALMIRPDAWRRLYKPRYARLIEKAHKHGMKFILHSCGYVVDIIEDLIEIGLDVLQKDDIAFMGMEALAERFAGRICFMGALDIQRILPGADAETIFQETRRLLRLFAKNDGGYIGIYYSMPESAGISWRQQFIMHAAFARYGKYPIK
jgi:uroporphyrinogen decarboxylase